METNTPLNPPQKYISLQTASIALVTVAILVLGLGFILRQDLLNRMEEEANRRQEALDPLSRKLNALDAELAQLAARPSVDATSVETLRGELGTAHESLAQLDTRLTALEKKPSAQPPATPAAAATVPAAASDPLFEALDQAVKAGNTYQTELAAWEKEHSTPEDKLAKLQASAASGILTEEMLRSQLAALLDQATAPESTPVDNSLIARINTHLSGLVSIKKQAVLPLELKSLRENTASAPLPRLQTQVNALPPALKTRFEPWLAAVQARDEALSELNALRPAP